MDPAARLAGLLDDYSLEMTGKDVAELSAARELLPAGARVNITFLGGEDVRLRLAAAAAVKAYGLTPVPHISARRLSSRRELADFLEALRLVRVAADNVFVAGGDPDQPQGPFADSRSVIDSGLLEDHGVRRVSIAGYPEGHPGIPGDVLWPTLTGKLAALDSRGLAAEVITQFGFDADPVLDWIAAVRERGFDVPIRVGVPGPAGVRRLLRFATRFGVGTSAGLAQRYGADLLATAGPDAFLRALATDYHPDRHGRVKLHFYTFGGLRATTEWIRDFRSETMELAVQSGSCGSRAAGDIDDERRSEHAQRSHHREPGHPEPGADRLPS
ncbi:methylenetetrahydrofolate reductase [Actinoplanes sp. Pm04-4]|uniref:Methylenetetrahydrofolate reductase n=1 Tax=Paractinoplanes pyxinae TaxID=2997416 RepID=A0ABT4AY94_9ACTN|nr:methylenetetrahydrofolate reductase [Actinoplanes pyxinae]MCY1139221.1 methylenetetrahydrofolate reductase [Actinoplanes pyxinae]